MGSVSYDNPVFESNEDGVKEEVINNRVNNKVKDDTTYFMEKIYVPKVDDYSFSFAKLWAFTGPGFLMSMAYLDPGNLDADLQTGSTTGYKLLWIVLLATVLGLIVQRLSARLGVVTGKHLAEMCYRRYSMAPRLLIWINMEMAIIAADMQEVVGTAFAIYILSNRVVPLWAGVLITIFDTFTFLFLDKYGLRTLEMFFVILISIMVGTFGYMFVVAKPSGVGVIEGLVIPACVGCNFQNAFLQIIEIVGAIIMPHNLYLYSALVKSRKVDRKCKEEVSDANWYILIVACGALFVSFIINSAVLTVFADELYGKTNEQVLDTCTARHDQRIDFTGIPNNTELFEGDLFNSGVFLGCTFGMFSVYIWAIGILASGQASTMTGTYSGQFSMEGFLNLSWPRWKRVLLTRTLAIAPTLSVTLASGLDELSNMTNWMNALMCIELPFALLPCITFTASRNVMGDFVNGIVVKIIASTISLVIVVINVYFVIEMVLASFSGSIAVYIIVAVIGVFYLTFILYLVCCYLVVLGLNQLCSVPKIGKYFAEPDTTEYAYSEK